MENLKEGRKKNRIESRMTNKCTDRIELAGDVLVFAFPIAAAGLNLGKFAMDKTRHNGENQSLS